MNKYVLAILGMIFFPAVSWSAQSIYCPQNSGYINVGMSQAQVVGACGQPLSKQATDQPVMQQVPVLQLIYNHMGAAQSFYGVWSLPLGISTAPRAQGFGGNAGSLGATLEVDVVNNKIDSIRLNSSDTNAFSICNGVSLKVGDPVGSVYGACGTPTVVNKTYINVPVPSKTKPEIWIYQVDQYQSPISLTFVDGKLQSID